MTFSQIGDLAAHSGLKLECIAHGYLPLMISEYCTIGSYLGGLHTGTCNQACLRGKYWLKDRKDELFPLVTDQYCRMHVLNAKELHMAAHVPKFGILGINRLRLELKQEEAGTIGKITALYRELLYKGDAHPLVAESKIASVEHENITRGHYFRGVL